MISLTRDAYSAIPIRQNLKKVKKKGIGRERVRKKEKNWTGLRRCTEPSVLTWNVIIYMKFFTVFLKFFSFFKNFLNFLQHFHSYFDKFYEKFTRNSIKFSKDSINFFTLNSPWIPKIWPQQFFCIFTRLRSRRVVMCLAVCTFVVFVVSFVPSYLWFVRSFPPSYNRRYLTYFDQTWNIERRKYREGSRLYYIEFRPATRF